MEYLMQFQLSIYAVLAVSMLLVKIYHKEEVYSYSNRLFKAMLLGVMIIMLLEFLSWVFDGRPGNFAYIMNYLFNFLLFVFSPSVACFWVAYIHYKIYGDRQRVRKNLWFQYPILISGFLALINLIYPIVFKVPVDTNLFERLPLLSLNFAMAYIMVSYSVFLTIKNRSKLKRTVLYSVLLFVVFTILASIFQVFNYGLIVMYPVLALSIIVIYLFLETTSSSTDYLTDLYSRSRFDEFVTSRVENDEEFSVLMLDLDDYKQFNDEHGHVVGDRILIMYANLMKQVFSDKSLVARYGGDEFVVVVFENDIKTIISYKEDMKIKIDESNDPIFRTVKFSFGYSTRTKENQFGYDKLMKKSDDVMYVDKAVNKNFKRRKED